MLLFLIGYRGTGKTTVARHLAERLGWAWFDADVEIESRAKKTIAAIFAEEGESGFRDWEAAVVADLARENNAVIALGGGAILREANRHALLGRGKIIWLQADPQTLFERLSNDEDTPERRPNLTARGGRAEIEEVLAARAPIYEQLADLAVDTVNKSPAAVAGEILARLLLLPPTGEPA